MSLLSAGVTRGSHFGGATTVVLVVLGVLIFGGIAAVIMAGKRR